MERFMLWWLGARSAMESVIGQQQAGEGIMLAPKYLLAGLGTSVGVGIALGKLTGEGLKGQTHAFDGWLLDATRAVQSPVTDRAMAVMSAFGEPAALYPLAGLMAAGWLVQQRRKDSAAVALAIVGAQPSTRR